MWSSVQYMKNTMPAQPNWLRHTRSLIMEMPLHTRAIIRCDAPMVKQSSIMLP